MREREKIKGGGGKKKREKEKGGCELVHAEIVS